MMGLLVVLAAFAAMIAYCFISVNRRDKIINEGRPIMATIKNIRVAGEDGSGYSNLAYTLDVEGREVKGKDFFNPFYAPQMQPGLTVKIMYVDDKHYVFMFNE